MNRNAREIVSIVGYRNGRGMWKLIGVHFTLESRLNEVIVAR